MKREPFVSPQEQYDRLKDQIDSVEPHLRLLHRDYLLLRQGFRLTFAVDFHEIWGFANPVAEFLQAKRERESSPQEVVLEKQLACAGLFYGPGPTSHSVLLPPYVVELNDKLAQVRARLLTGASLAYMQEWLQELNNIAGEQPIRDALTEYQESHQISPDRLQRLREFLEGKADNLLFLVSGIASEGLGSIRDLLSGAAPRVQMTSARWPELAPLVRQTMEAPLSEWYGRFRRIRRGLKSTTSNIHDAKAIDLVLALNQRLRQEREIVLIVSDAPAMKKVLKRQPRDSSDETSRDYTWTEDGASVTVAGSQEPVPILRPIEAFYYLLLFQADSDLERSLEKLSDELKRIERVARLGKIIETRLDRCPGCTSVEQRKTCKFHDICDEIGQELLKHNKRYDTLTNVRLAVNTFPVLKPYWERVQRQQGARERLEEAAIELIEYLSTQIEPLESSLRKRERQLLKRMNGYLIDALRLAAKVSDAYQGEISQESLQRFTRTRYRIRFRDEKVTALVRDLERARYSGDAAGASRAYEQLQDIALQREHGPEGPLLWAVLLLCQGQHYDAIHLASGELPDVDAEYRPEYLYILALASYESRDYVQAIHRCESGVEEYVEDARFHHLCGLTIRKWQQEAPETCVYSRDDAIEYVRQAYDLTAEEGEEKDLRGWVTNDLACLLCLRNEPGDLEKALGHVEECWRIVAYANEMPEFLYTRGCVMWRLAVRETDEEIRQQRASEALDNLGRACERAKSTGVDQRDLQAYETALREAGEQLEHLNPPD